VLQTKLKLLYLDSTFCVARQTLFFYRVVRLHKLLNFKSLSFHLFRDVQDSTLSLPFFLGHLITALLKLILFVFGPVELVEQVLLLLGGSHH
jgi:hypothetical protein